MGENNLEVKELEKNKEENVEKTKENKDNEKNLEASENKKEVKKTNKKGIIIGTIICFNTVVNNICTYKYKQ